MNSALINQNIKQERLLQIILRPHLSEKSALVGDKYRQFVFKVAANADKTEIKQAVEVLFNVKVGAIRVCNVRGKERRFKQMTGHRKGWKKAYVSLQEGYDIDFTGIK